MYSCYTIQHMWYDVCGINTHQIINVSTTTSEKQMFKSEPNIATRTCFLNICVQDVTTHDEEMNII